MKIVLLAAASSIHTVRWANGLRGSGHEVHLITQQLPVEPVDSGVTVHQLPRRGALGYFLMVPTVKRILKRVRPDIVSAHYASGYGTTARFVNYHPWLLSVWGGDVYDFPSKSRLHRWLIEGNLKAADNVASTSSCMAEEVRRLLPELNEIDITPFGVDVVAFGSAEPNFFMSGKKVVIGTVKTMRPKYGIDTLIKAYAMLVSRLGRRRDAPELELRLVGGGSQTNELRALALSLGVSSNVHFVGQVPHTEVPRELARLDIYVALSRMDSESFGVAVIEASAAGLPVVVSDAGGLPEVTLDGQTGFVVPREDPRAAADALEKLVFDAGLRNRMGCAGREHVRKNYSWPACIQIMNDVYCRTIKRSSEGN